MQSKGIRLVSEKDSEVSEESLDVLLGEGFDLRLPREYCLKAE